MLKFYREGVLKNIVPLMLCVSIVTSCMYVYSKAWLALFILITAAIQTTVFSFYSYISGKSMLLRFISILGSFFAIAALVVIAVRTGNNKSSIDYFIWFLSPQSLVDFSFAYIAATFIIINFFIASTVYYFSAVRYRISMTFLITLIPFAVYRKEGEQVPVPFALLLLVMYMALMIHCRQVVSKPRQKMIVDRGYKRSMVVFLAFTSLLALVLPKPDVGFDNSWVDTALENEKLTNYMMERLGIMSETASSSVIYTQAEDIKLFEFYTEESPLNLKSQTFSKYNYETNKWYASEKDKTGKDISDSAAAELNPSEFYKAVAAACENDSYFAEKYGFEDFSPELKNNYNSIIRLNYTRIPIKYYFSPVLAYRVSGTGDREILRSSSGMIYSTENVGNSYLLNYYSDQSIYEKNMQSVVKALDIGSFGNFLSEMVSVFAENGIDEYDSVMSSYVDDYMNALVYMYSAETDMPDSIAEITEKVIHNKKSDYEKAAAIESYLRMGDFEYSLKYQKPEGYNMEYFLSEGKTGICSDFATAMVLMSRAAGIPARYTEGIKLHDPDTNGIVEVTDKDLHAYPELYISGYGWKSFDPTPFVSEEGKGSFDVKLSAVFAVTAFLLIIFIMFSDRYIIPYFSEKLFRRRLSKASEEKAVEMIVLRLRKKLELDDSTTSSELARYIYEVYGADAEDMSDEFDNAVYGGKKVTPGAGGRALEKYLMLTDRRYGLIKK